MYKALGLAELPIVEAIKEALLSPEMSNLIHQGKITFAMIKPRLDESTQLGDNQSDYEIANAISHKISMPLEVVFEASFVFTDEMIEEFYGGIPKERQLESPPIDPNRYGKQHASRWDEFKALMKQGPVTGLILYSEQGNAVMEWRNQMGNDWKITKVKETYPDSLRARYGNANHNNLLHGSDSSESVMYEIEFFTRALDKLKNDH